MKKITIHPVFQESKTGAQKAKVRHGFTEYQIKKNEETVNFRIIQFSYSGFRLEIYDLVNVCVGFKRLHFLSSERIPTYEQRKDWKNWETGALSTNG